MFFNRKTFIYSSDLIVKSDSHEYWKRMKAVATGEKFSVMSFFNWKRDANVLVVFQLQ